MSNRRIPRGYSGIKEKSKELEKKYIETVEEEEKQEITKQMDNLFTEFKFMLIKDLQHYGLPANVKFDNLPLNTISLTFGNKSYVFNTEDLRILDLVRFPSNSRNRDVVERHALELAAQPMLVPCMLDGVPTIYEAVNMRGTLLVRSYIDTVYRYIKVMNLCVKSVYELTWLPDNFTDQLDGIVREIYGTIDPKVDVERIFLS